MKYSLLLLLFPIFESCSKENHKNNPVDYREKMRELVIEISNYARKIRPGFYIIPQNGIELVVQNGIPHQAYLNAIDAVGQEELLYGYDNQDDHPTPPGITTQRNYYLAIAQNAGKSIFITDYCSTPQKTDSSYLLNSIYGYTAFVACNRELNCIPSLLPGENNLMISELPQVKNFLYLINPEKFRSKTDFITAVTATNYDMLIMDLFFQDDSASAFTPEEINLLKQKANGGKRLLISYLSAGEAEHYRYYWQQTWDAHKPDWLGGENPDWPGNYLVHYWQQGWQQLIYGNNDSYLKKILAAGFDGVYLDLIDAYECFEE